MKKTFDYSSITTSKKENMKYWDQLEKIVAQSLTDVISLGFGQNKQAIDNRLELTKDITSYITQTLERELDINFPYLDENY